MRRQRALLAQQVEHGLVELALRGGAERERRMAVSAYICSFFFRICSYCALRLWYCFTLRGQRPTDATQQPMLRTLSIVNMPYLALRRISTTSAPCWSHHHRS